MFTTVAVSSVNAPPLINVKLSAVFVPVNCVELSSSMLTAPPVVLKFNLPKLIVSEPVSPMVIEDAVASKLAMPPTLITLPVASVISPFAVRSKLPAETTIPYKLMASVSKTVKLLAPIAVVSVSTVVLSMVSPVLPDWKFNCVARISPNVRGDPSPSTISVVPINNRLTIVAPPPVTSIVLGMVKVPLPAMKPIPSPSVVVKLVVTDPIFRSPVAF